MNRQQGRTLLCVIMIILYAAGLIALFMGSLGLGFALWVISTTGGFLTLYFIREHDEEAEQKKPEDDKPCE